MAVARVETCWQPSAKERTRIIEAVADALVVALRLPRGDPTVIGVTCPLEDVVLPKKVGDHYTIVRVTMFSGRTVATKRALYERLVECLGGCGVPASDVLIILDEVPAENWGVDGGVPASDVDVGFKIDI